MCILFAYVDPSPDPGRFKLILMMNRDEFFHRRTSAAEWKDGILCGRDMGVHNPGGTWCGVDKTGRIGTLTNLLMGGSKELACRGSLVTKYLSGSEHSIEYLNNLADSDIVYKPFNLMLMEQNESTGAYEVYYLAQELDGKSSKRNVGPFLVDETVLALSNHPLSEPFRKTTKTRLLAEEVFQSQNSVDTKDQLVQSLFEILSLNRMYYPDPQIDKQRRYDKFLKQNYRHVGSTYISGTNNIAEGFGTRSQTAILVDYYNSVDFIERTRNVVEANEGLEEYWSEVAKTFPMRV